MNILDKIVANKRREVEERKDSFPVAALEKSLAFKYAPYSLKTALQVIDGSGIIAEHKRQSPSKGIINDKVKVEDVTKGYLQAGAAALSILTDKDFFGGTMQDIIAVREAINIPILRKEFMIDEYQIIEAKSIGADAILLLANVLNKNQIKQFTDTAHSLGLEVLLEIREKEELDSLYHKVDCVGVNNRNLKDFKVNLSQSFDLAKDIPAGMAKISESGIDSPQTIRQLKEAGFRGFLIGETFMKEADPAKACALFIEQLKAIK